MTGKLIPDFSINQFSYIPIYLWFRKNTIATLGGFQPGCQPGVSSNGFMRQENQNYLVNKVAVADVPVVHATVWNGFVW